ncbi:hypothetical protein VTK73DRAFT_3959 [Phialemonium thermophilum]|uniref:SWR1-complex protein 4 n=1 Tax=Phialemonium thermophilum TaxID=223376 RepID=A0ABR3Y0M8_9PEZI
MASHDLRDVLNLSGDHAAGPRPAKKQKVAVPRPSLKGLAREVQNLGGDNPIAIVPDVQVFKKRRIANRKPAARWELRPFRNSARGGDGKDLILRHWRRKADGVEQALPPSTATEQSQSADGVAPPTGIDSAEADEDLEDSTFAKFNVEVVVPQYNEDQYYSNLANGNWTKEETDYLLKLAKEFDLRWPIIWDRYDFVSKPQSAGAPDGSDTAVIPAPKSRSMEDLKARYYEVAAKMMAVQKPAQYMTRPEFELYEMMANFNPSHEKSRKEFLMNAMARSKDEAREEESLLLEIKRILARTERFNEERRELYNRLDYPHTDQDISAYKTSSGLQTLFQNLMNIDKNKKRKSIMGGPENASPASAGPNGQPASATSDAARRESIAAATANGRDGQRGTPATPVEASSAAAAAAASGGPGALKKKGSAAQVERRKLSEQEEQIYGVSHHDRLSSGPTFRYEKINKLYSHKSGQQQLRITNVMNELDIPPRLVMPTAAVTAQFEVLWGAVTTLVDLRKLSDKLDTEIKLEEAKKAERDKAKGLTSASKPETDAENEKGAANAGTMDKSTTGPSSGENGGENASSGTALAPAGGHGQGKPAPPKDGVATDQAPVKTEEEGAGDEGDGPLEHEKEQDKGSRPGSRPGSSGTAAVAAHKRSASVLSTTSDKSSKRQKR